jgi:hypothetical protein
VNDRRVTFCPIPSWHVHKSLLTLFPATHIDISISLTLLHMLQYPSCSGEKRLGNKGYEVTQNLHWIQASCIPGCRKIRHPIPYLAPPARPPSRRKNEQCVCVLEKWMSGRGGLNMSSLLRSPLDSLEFLVMSVIAMTV